MDKYGLSWTFVWEREHFLVAGSTGTGGTIEPNRLDMRLLRHQGISGILAPHYRMTEGEQRLFYPVTGRKPLDVWLKSRRLTQEEAARLLYKVASILEEGRMLMLQEQQFLVDESFIFMGEHAEDVAIVYLPMSVPAQSPAVQQQYRALVGLLLGDADDASARLMAGVTRPLPVMKQELADMLLGHASDDPVHAKEDGRIASRKHDFSGGLSSLTRKHHNHEQLPGAGAARISMHPTKQRPRSQPIIPQALSGEPKAASSGMHARASVSFGRLKLTITRPVTVAVAAGALVCTLRATLVPSSDGMIGLSAAFVFLTLVCVWVLYSGTPVRITGTLGESRVSGAIAPLFPAAPLAERSQAASAVNQPDPGTTLLQHPDATVLLDELDQAASSTQKGAYVEWQEEGQARRLFIRNGRLTIGRSPDAQLRIDQTGVSRAHAEIEQIEAGYVIVDLGSTNGTFLNESRLVPFQRIPLQSGDKLCVAKGEYIFRSND